MLQRLRRSTFGLIAIVALGFALVTVAIGVLSVRVTHEALEEQLDDRVNTETEALLADDAQIGVARLVEAIRLRDSARKAGEMIYLLFDTEGRQIAGSVTPSSGAHEGYDEHFVYRRDGKNRTAQAMGTRFAGGLLIVGADREELVDIDEQLTTLFFVALAAVLVVGIGSATLIGLAIRRRLERIETTAQAIMKGEFTRRIPVDGSDSEFDRLAAVLNQMLDRIGGLMENLRQVSSDVAHDLRTPLTRLFNSLDRASRETDPQTRIEGIRAAREQSAELLEIFSALLRIAEIEGMAERLPRHRLDLSQLVEQMAESYRPNFEDGDYRFSIDVEPGLQLDGDRRLISQALANLLDNVLRHTPSGSSVTLSARREAGALCIAIADDGPGVDSAEVGRLFQRFARSERSRSTPGHGLGLSLVAAIAAAHGGTASAEGTQGFRVVLTLPAPR